jgi:uncharacterized protein YciI
MRITALLFVAFLTVINLSGQIPNPGYNKTLADSLGADEYGMKNYFFVILKTGTNNDPDKEKINSAFNGHMENMARMVKMGKLIVAGPFGKNDRAYRGLFIINASTEDETLELLQSDPAIREKYLEPEILNWYGSAALPMYLKHAAEISLKTF